MAEPSTIFFIDYSGSMTDAQVDRAAEIARERMSSSSGTCGTIGFDFRASPLAEPAPGPVAASRMRRPQDARGGPGGGTDAKAALRLCEEWARDIGPVRKVLLTDGYADPGDLRLFDEVVIVPHCL